MKTKLISIKEVIIKPELYPRQSYDWRTSLSYSESMKTGSKFPNVVVALIDKKYYLVDGKHRLEAYKMNKEEYVTVEILERLTERQVFVEAIKRNSIHGKPFNAYDKRHLILKLESMNMPISQISELIRISVGSIKKFVGNSLTYTGSGKPIVLKSPFKDLKNEVVSEDFESEQDYIGNLDINSVLNTFEMVLRNNSFDLQDEYVLKKFIDIKELLNKILGSVKYEKNRM